MTLPRRSVAFLFAAAALAAHSPPLYSQERTEEVQVTAKKQSPTDRPSSGSATVIDMGDNAARFQSIDEVLEREAAVRVRRYGGLGSYSTLSIRGSNANQVNVFIDGIPLNNALTGEVNLSDLGLENVRQLELYRSGSPGQFSGSAVGGALNLVTGPSEKAKSGEKVWTGVGSLETARAGGTVWRPDWFFTGQTQVSDQNFVFRNDNGTPVLNTLDDYDTHRKNAQFREASSTGSKTWQTGTTEIKVLEDWKYRFQGVPGPGSNQTEDTERKFWRSTTGIKTDTKSLFVDEFRLMSRFYYTGTENDLYDPKRELSSGNSDSHQRAQQYGMHLLPVLYLTDYHQTIRILLASERQALHADIRNQYDQLVDRVPARFRTQSSAHIEDEFSFFEERLLIAPSIKYEHIMDRFYQEIRSLSEFDARTRVRHEFTNYGLGVRFTAIAREKFKWYFKANGASEKRMPNFLELFGEQGTVLGNPDLKPEASESVEGGTGIAWKNPSHEGTLEVNAFSKKIKDMILFVPNSQFSLRPENVDAASINGVEVTLKGKAWSMIRGDLNYTYQRAINESDVTYLRGKYLPLRPLHEMRSSLALFNNYGEVGMEADFTGAVFKDRTNEYFGY
ncbi:MAG: TonB-dependent receptor plug domain-containing protein, partial [Spirochaetia bacterium]|nr:TonB-dependent receptor plug domain-containing protein [Spirochaetia bacterium]